MTGESPLLVVHGLRVRYRTRQGAVHALRGVSLAVDRGETVGVVGESGSGKSSLALALLRLLPESADYQGSALFQGRDLFTLPEAAVRELRGRRIALVLQAAANIWSPVMRVGDHVVESIQVHLGLPRPRAWREAESLAAVIGLPPEVLRWYPHQLSGGMKQRAALVLAFAGRPDLVIADEPASGLDSLSQRTVLEGLRTLRARSDAALVFISHDLRLVAALADRMVVMYAGRIVEQGPGPTLLQRPAHPYTAALVHALPPTHRARERGLVPIPGGPPDPLALPAGCPFHPRCPSADDLCRTNEPVLVEHGPSRQAACWRPFPSPP